MWSKQLKDKKVRGGVEKKEFKNLASLFLVNDSSLDLLARFLINKNFLNSNKSNFKSQIKNRCVISLRSRGPLRDFHLSRISFRSKASSGLLLGVKKSSW